MLLEGESSNIYKTTSGNCNLQTLLYCGILELPLPLPPLCLFLSFKCCTFFGSACPYWSALLPALGYTSCCQMSNQIGRLSQIRCKIRKKETKREVDGGIGGIAIICHNKSQPSKVAIAWRNIPLQSKKMNQNASMLLRSGFSPNWKKLLYNKNLFWSYWIFPFLNQFTCLLNSNEASMCLHLKVSSFFDSPREIVKIKFKFCSPRKKSIK